MEIKGKWNTRFQRAMTLPAFSDCALTLAARRNLFGFGGDYSNGQSVNWPGWPFEMKNLANTRNRIGGIFIKAEDIFFFAGNASEFNSFLNDYSKVRNIEKHWLILHEGIGEAQSFDGKPRRNCDWKLQGRPVTQFTKVKAAGSQNDSDYILEVHFWTGGNIALNEVAIPKNIKVLNAT